MSPPRILIVDDQRDISRMLKVALETSGRGYIVVDVPSAEEALLEVRRGPVDLLITDLRLPGINGVELIKRLRNMASRAQMIVISAHADDLTQAECRRLGAIFMPKPLGLEDFLAASHAALGEQAKAKAAPVEEEAPAEISVADRLTRLRRDLGASAIFLVDLDGRIVVRAGDITDINLERVFVPLMAAFSASLKVSRSLGGLVPTNMQFFDGDHYDAYCANVGQQFALVMMFVGERGATQMGPVMRYGRQCADDLLNSLQRMGVEPDPAPDMPARAPEPVVLAPAVIPPAAAPVWPTRPAGNGPTPPAARTPKTAPLGAARTPEAAPTPPQPAPQPAPTPAAPLTAAELKALEEAAQKVTADAAASFWDTATGEAEIGDVRSDTLSFEQAQKLGLVPPQNPSS